MAPRAVPHRGHPDRILVRERAAHAEQCVRAPDAALERRALGCARKWYA